MELGERSLHDACARERIAGNHLEQTRQAAKSVATCLQLLHKTDVCHCDVKQRNIIRLHEKWVLCDMDGATHVNQPIAHGGKFSAYARQNLRSSSLPRAPG